MRRRARPSCSAKPPPPAAASIFTPVRAWPRRRDRSAPPGDIGFAALRGGTVTGDHSVIFAGAMERIELTHRAEDRTMFAQGAVKAALWAQDKKPGFYTMTDVLGLADF